MTSVCWWRRAINDRVAVRDKFGKIVSYVCRQWWVVLNRSMNIAEIAVIVIEWKEIHKTRRTMLINIIILLGDSGPRSWQLAVNGLKTYKKPTPTFDMRLWITWSHMSSVEWELVRVHGVRSRFHTTVLLTMRVIVWQATTPGFTRSHCCLTCFVTSWFLSLVVTCDDRFLSQLKDANLSSKIQINKTCCAVSYRRKTGAGNQQVAKNTIKNKKIQARRFSFFWHCMQLIMRENCDGLFSLSGRLGIKPFFNFERTWPVSSQCDQTAFLKTLKLTYELDYMCANYLLSLRRISFNNFRGKQYETQCFFQKSFSCEL